MDTGIITVTIPLVVAVVGAVIAVWKFATDLSFSSGTKRREQYKFAHDFINEWHTNKTLHPFVIESGCQALAASKFVKAVEVEYILNLEESYKSLKYFTFSREYVVFNEKRNIKISFKKEYKIRKRRDFLKGWYFVLYFVFGMAPFCPLITFPFFSWKTSSVWMTTGLSVVPCWGLAAFFLYQNLQITRAEELVFNQRPLRSLKSKEISEANELAM